MRLLGDKEIRLLQVGGSARLSSYARRVFQHGWRSAHADEVAAADADLALVTAAGSLRLETTDVPSPAPSGALSGQTRLIAWLVAALVFVIGARGILSGSLPAIGQFTPFPSWGATFGQFFAGWHPSGVGTTAPAAPALAISGVVGTVLFGAMGLTQKVLVFACVPLGVFGTVRLLRPFGSGRAALVAGMAYLAMALPYDALATGRWGALVLYAGMPWVLARLFAATGIGPFGARAEQPPPEAGWFARHPALSSMLGLGVLEAVLISFVPAAAFVVVLAAVGLVLSSLVFGDGRQTGRALGIAAGSTVVAGVICLPWLIGVLSAGTGALAVLGTPIPASSAASWGSLLRFAVGPIGDSPLAWGFAVAGVVPLVLARGERFRFAARLWVIAVAGVVRRLGDRARMDGAAGHRHAGAAGARRGRDRRGDRARCRRLRKGPRACRVRLATARAGDRGRRGRARSASDPGVRAPRPLRPPGERFRPIGELDAGSCHERRVPSALARGPARAQPGRVERG